jgi:hypothetical protein
MIIYNLGETDCKISFRDFLKITTKDMIKYKSDFKEFSELYELIEKNKKNITHILFDGYEYYIEKGLLHNLYGPALIKHNDDPKEFFKGTSIWFYIDGKKVYDNLCGKGCRKLEDFQNNEIFHFQEISNKISGRDPDTGKLYRRKEGIDYKTYPIDLKERIKIDQRKKKLEILKYVNRR